MKREVILELFEKFEQASYNHESVEYWSARELQEILGYSRWENFVNVINKAKKSCESAGSNIMDHFRDVTKMILIAKGAQREVEDVALTRYACYLIAQNGDPGKAAIAFAQTYFAVQTRKQEIIEQRLIDVERVTAREKLTKSERKLSGILYERGVDGAGFAIIKSKGDQALFGGFSTNDMKKKLGVSGTKPLADFLPTLTIKAKDFANELTSHNVIEKDLNKQIQISQEHVDNNKAVREILLKRGVRPEALPPAEDVKKLERRLESDEKKAAKGSK
jgi:DNA-damage-inducible protein D